MKLISGFFYSMGLNLLALILLFPADQTTTAWPRSLGWVFLVNWTSENTEFQTEKNGIFFHARLSDRFIIRCPEFADDVLENDTEQSTIYLVSKSNYDECVLDSDAVPIGTCRDPYRYNGIKFTLRDYQPNPRMHPYFAGRTYYYISTSSGQLDGIDNRSGGLCKEKNMRFFIKIARFPGDETDPNELGTVETGSKLEQSSDKEYSSGTIGSWWQPETSGVDNKNMKAETYNANGVPGDVNAQFYPLADEGKMRVETLDSRTEAQNQESGTIFYIIEEEYSNGANSLRLSSSFQHLSLCLLLFVPAILFGRLFDVAGWRT